MNEFQISHIKNDRCIACNSSNLKVILDLGNQPLANNYHKGEKQEEYPLMLNLCFDCYHLQLSHIVNPDLMFKNYLYVSGTSQTLKDYFDFFSKETLKYFPDAKTVLDIACNDGTQLDSFKKLNLSTHGIDPAENLYKISTSKGHNIICDYFNSNVISKFNNKFDIITAQNVLAHTKYAYDFIKSCKEIMHNKSVLFVQTSQSNMIVNNEFDTIYHEHLSYFNVNSMKKLVERCGMFLNDVFKTDVHGTSYVFVITKTNHLNKNGVEELIKLENEQGLYNILTYPNYVYKCFKSVIDLKKKIEDLKSKGYNIIGYGAAAKGNTLLNFGKIKLDVIIDDNSLKHNLYTPGMDIPIVSSDYLNDLKEESKVAFVPLAWNFFTEIKTRIKNKRINSNDLFIKYFPTLEVTNEN